MPDFDLDVVLPDESSTLDPALLVDLARRAEDLGYARAWLPDHLLPPEPYGETYGGVLEPLTTLAYLAATTSTLRLGTSVLVLPLRNPFAVAKQAATLHRLSGGRFTLGVGAGWDATEFASVGADFATRGPRTAEGVALLRHLFTGEGPFEGEFHRYERGFFEPRPDGPLPIMTGGMSLAALRRAAAHADEWQAVGVDGPAFAAKVAQLRSLGDRPVRVGARIGWPGGEAEFTEAVATARGLAGAGARSVAVWFGDGAGFADRMARFAAAVR